MSAGKHTEGPWLWYRPRSNYKKLVGADNATVLTADEYAGSSWIEIENEANACLIAAAPDMLEALKYTLKTMLDEAESRDFDPPANCEVIAWLEGAIAKAEGR